MLIIAFVAKKHKVMTVAIHNCTKLSVLVVGKKSLSRAVMSETLFGTISIIFCNYIIDASA